MIQDDERISTYTQKYREAGTQRGITTRRQCIASWTTGSSRMGFEVDGQALCHPHGLRSAGGYNLPAWGHHQPVDPTGAVRHPDVSDGHAPGRHRAGAFRLSSFHELPVGHPVRHSHLVPMMRRAGPPGDLRADPQGQWANRGAQ